MKNQNSQGKILVPHKQLSLRETSRMYRATLQSLQNMSVRCQLVACELQRIDKDNKIFSKEEGVFDKVHLFEIRKALKSGQYDKNRKICKIITKKGT